MATCNCCVTYGSQILVGGADVSNQTISISVDSTQEVIWEDQTDVECDPLGDSKFYMYGPSKATVQLTAYPFAQGEDCTLGFTCPTTVNLSVGWKTVFDCRGCDPCYDPRTGQIAGQRRGRLVNIPLKKKQVTVTGDIDSSPYFEVGGCAVPAARYTLTAGPQAIITPQPTMQYSELAYTGLPIPFDTEDLLSSYTMTIQNTDVCPWASGFQDIRAYLDSFSFSFNPPQAPQVVYSFSVMLSFCPEC
jgi:hypothetical protein